MNKRKRLFEIMSEMGAEIIDELDYIEKGENGWTEVRKGYVEALKLYSGNVSYLAKDLGISKGNLCKRLRKYEVVYGRLK